MATKKNTYSPQKLHQALSKQGYLCDRRFAAKVASSITTKPTSGSFLFGPAGTGKSFLPQALASVVGADEVFYQCFPGTREDDLLVKMLPDEETKSGIKLFDGPILKAIHLSNNGDGKTPVFLTLDEWDKTRPSADSFLLDFLQNGRVTFQGDEHIANLERLYVFVTMNDERDLSEPLLRRLPLIEFDHLEPQLVYEALKLTHKDSKHLDAAIALYERCVMADMSKPATIQELRQLLDAINSLGSDADWDDLVFQYITKTQENHMLLKMAEKKNIEWKRKEKEEAAKLEADKYELSDGDADKLKEKEKNAQKAAMPKMSDVRDFDLNWDGRPQTEDIQTYGILQRNSRDYDRIVHLITDPNEHAGDLGNNEEDLVVANVSDHDIRLLKPVPLIYFNKVRDLFNAQGEVMFIEPMATYGDVKALAKKTNLEVIKYSKGEMIAKAPGIHLRCTKELGAEIIVDLDFYDEFDSIFGVHLEDDEERDYWLSGNKNVEDLENAVIVKPKEYGLMFRKHFLRGVKGYHKALIKNRYDIWGSGWDSVPDSDIPHIEDFHKEDYRILQSGNSSDRFYLVDNIVFGFFGTDNDMFGLKILGRFDKKYYKYLKAWVPEEGVEVRFDEIIVQAKKEETLIKEFGYAFSSEDKAMLTKTYSSGLFVEFSGKTNKLTMNADLPKDKMSYKKLDALLADMETTWRELRREH